MVTMHRVGKKRKANAPGISLIENNPPCQTAKKRKKSKTKRGKRELKIEQ